MLCCTTVWCSAHSNNPFSEAAATVWWSEFLGNAFHSWQQLLQVFPGNILAITPNKYSWKNKTKIIIIKYTCTAWGQVTDAKKERKKKFKPQYSTTNDLKVQHTEMWVNWSQLVSPVWLVAAFCVPCTRVAYCWQGLHPKNRQYSQEASSSKTLTDLHWSIKYKNTGRSLLKYIQF